MLDGAPTMAMRRRTGPPFGRCLTSQVIIDGDTRRITCQEHYAGKTGPPAARLPSMPAHRFDLVGGDPVLDFANTIHDWTAPEPRDYVPTFPEALRFAEAAG